MLGDKLRHHDSDGFVAAQGHGNFINIFQQRLQEKAIRRSQNYQAYASGAWANGLTVDRKGCAVVAAYAYAAGASGENLAAVWKLTSAGGTAWHREFSNSAWPHDGEFNAVGTDSKCRVYAAGDVYVAGTTGNLLMVRYSAAGSEQAMWRSVGQQSGYCAFSDVLVLTDTQVIAAGQVAGNGADAAVYRAKTTP